MCSYATGGSSGKARTRACSRSSGSGRFENLPVAVAPSRSSSTAGSIQPPACVGVASSGRATPRAARAETSALRPARKARTERGGDATDRGRACRVHARTRRLISSTPLASAIHSPVSTACLARPAVRRSNPAGRSSHRRETPSRKRSQSSPSPLPSRSIAASSINSSTEPTGTSSARVSRTSSSVGRGCAGGRSSGSGARSSETTRPVSASTRGRSVGDTASTYASSDSRGTSAACCSSNLSARSWTSARSWPSACAAAPRSTRRPSASRLHSRAISDRVSVERFFCRCENGVEATRANASASTASSISRSAASPSSHDRGCGARDKGEIPVEPHQPLVARWRKLLVEPGIPADARGTEVAHERVQRGVEQALPVELSRVGEPGEGIEPAVVAARPLPRLARLPWLPRVRVRQLAGSVDLEELPDLAFEQARIGQQPGIRGLQLLRLRAGRRDADDETADVLVALGRLDQPLAHRTPNEGPAPPRALAAQESGATVSKKARPRAASTA